MEHPECEVEVVRTGLFDDGLSLVGEVSKFARVGRASDVDVRAALRREQFFAGLFREIARVPDAASFVDRGGGRRKREE